MSGEALIEQFYSAFDRHDGDAMAACYGPSIRFSDPVFPDLRGPEAGAMWRMLTEGAEDLSVELVDHEASDERGRARWVAKYTFSQTGRSVVNDVQASFRFEDGLIVEHTDEFDFYRWARQALGPRGLLLGWTPLVRNAVRSRARASLEQYMAGASQ